MAKETFSFDIISEADLQEVDNAVNQALKEVAQRYDFKNSKSSIDYNRAEKKITLIADDDFKLRALKEILATRLAKRGVSLKSLDFKEPEKAFEGYLRQLNFASGRNGRFEVDSFSDAGISHHVK